MRTLVCEFQRIFLDDEERSGSPGRHYSYAYIGNKDVKRGDWALVHNGTNFGVVEIKRAVPGIEPSVTKHVIEVLTQPEFEAYKERNKTIDDMRANLDTLEYRLAQHKKMKRYEELAEEDPGAREILIKLQKFFGMNTSPAIETSSSTSGSVKDERVTREDVESARGNALPPAPDGSTNGDYERTEV